MRKQQARIWLAAAAQPKSYLGNKRLITPMSVLFPDDDIGLLPAGFPSLGESYTRMYRV